MRPLMLYPEPQRAAVETCAARPRNPNGCNLCSLGAKANTNCMGAELQARTDPWAPVLLVVGGSPTEVDDRRGRPFVSPSGDWIRQLLSRRWKGNVVYDHALKCAAGRSPPEESYDACRPFLAAVVADARPERILLLGAKAALGVVGSCPPLDSVRRAYTHVGEAPAFLFQDPAFAMRNRFWARAFEEDLDWALKAWPPTMSSSVARVVRTLADAREAWEQLRPARWLAFDTETSGTMFTGDFVVLTVALCDPDGRLYVWEREAVEDAHGARTYLHRLLEKGGPPKVGQNLKYDIKAVQALGIDVAPIGGDTRIQRRLLSSESRAALAVQQWMVGMGGGKDEVEEVGSKAATDFKRLVKKICKSAPKGEGFSGIDMQVHPGLTAEQAAVARAMRGAELRGDDRKAWYLALVDPDLRARYCGKDTISTARLQIQQEAQMAAEPNIARTWEELVRPSVAAYTRMEIAGIGVNVARAAELSRVIRDRQAPILDRLRAYECFAAKTDEELRTAMNSPVQRCNFLYEHLGLKDPDGRRSSDKEALAALDHPAVTDLRLWNELDKLRSTYADGLPRFVGSDGRVHPDFNVDGTRAGRTSCQDPNLQNIPRARSDLAKWCKSIFEAAPGHKFIQLDYSQLELRVACQLSGDPVMEEMFASGEDYHLRTGRGLHDARFDPYAEEEVLQGMPPNPGKIPWDDLPEIVRKLYRDVGKTFNFALVFQQGDDALARNMKADRESAARVRSLILGRLKVLREWMARTVEQARRDGCIWTLWGGRKARRRLLWDLGESNRKVVGHAERQAGNGVIQGSANEFKIASLAAIDRWLREDGIPARPVLEVHDSIMIETRIDSVAEVIAGARAIMEGWPTCGPGKAALKVDVEMGDSWGAMEKII